MNAADVIENARRVAYNLSLDGHAWAAGSIEALLALGEEQAEQIDGMVTKDWHGLRAILDQVYPADMFPTLPDRAGRDDGPRIVSLLRNLDRAEATIARVQALADRRRTPVHPVTLRAALDGESE